MEFIVVTVAIMTVSSLVIYKMLRFGGVKINMQPLILCGILALLVNFSAIAISSYLTTTHFVMLGVLVLMAAASATWYNHWIDMRNSYPVPAVLIHDDTVDDISTDEEQPLSDEEENEDIPEFVHDTEVDGDSRVLSTEFMYDMPPATTDVDVVDTVNVNEENDTSENIVDSDEQTEQDAPEPVIEETKPIVDEAEQLVEEAEPATDETDKPAEETKLVADEVEQTAEDAEPVIDEVEQSAEDAEPATDESEQSTDEVNEINEINEINEPESEPTPPVSDDVIAAVSAMETLDDLLDYAFEEKTLHHDDNSLYASAEALRRYRDDSYAPFVAIDMINICKARGDYQRTVAIYQDALNLPAVKESQEMQQEFLSGMAYISCIVDVLNKHGQQHVPISEIPKHIMEEIEKTYSSRKNNP